MRVGPQCLSSVHEFFGPWRKCRDKKGPPAPAGIPSTPLEIGHPLLKIKKKLLVHRNRLSDLLKDTYTSEASAWVGQPLCGCCFLGWLAKTLFKPNSIRGATKRKAQTQSLPGGWIAPESLATWRQLFTKLFSLASACCTARAPQTWRLSWGQGSWNFCLLHCMISHTFHVVHMTFVLFN